MEYPPYLVQMQDNTDQNNSEYGQFSRSAMYRVDFFITRVTEGFLPYFRHSEEILNLQSTQIALT